jgi:hypothetical protein
VDDIVQNSMTRRSFLSCCNNFCVLLDYWSSHRNNWVTASVGPGSNRCSSKFNVCRIILLPPPSLSLALSFTFLQDHRVIWSNNISECSASSFVGR